MKFQTTNLLLVLGLYLLTLFSGCKAGTESLFSNTISLKGRMLSVGENLGHVHSIEAVDDYLILTDDHGRTMYTILKPDLSYCFHFGRKGQGPGEMTQASGVKMIRNGYLTLSDGYRLYRHSLDSLYRSVDNPVSTPKSKKIDTHVWVADLSDSVFVATGTFPNGKRFKFLDDKGALLAYEGDYPLEEKTELPFYIVGVSFLSMMASHPASNRFAVGTYYGGMFDVMEWNQQDFTLHRIGGICDFKPRLTSKDYMGTPNFAPDDQTRYGYIHMDSDAEYVYALYSGRFVKDGENISNIVHVFDWNGNPVCKITLDKDVRNFAIAGSKIYALYEDADIGYEIIEYVLPDNWMKK